jgi:predicted CxxxxCH...CXXCH cytochrome family protein
VVTNVAANKVCTDCHDALVVHINGINDTTYTGQRLLATINGVTAITTFNGACYACHATGGTTPATSLVSTHGNTNATFVAPAKDTAGAETFAYNCNACHNVHGMTNGSGFNNIYMVKPTIGVGNSFTSAPGGTDVTTIGAVRLERVSGVNSLDDGATTADNVCYTCHNNANRPGSGTAMRQFGGDHSGNSGGYTSNDTTKNCASCHVHNYDAVQVATTDGFMPQQCNACHDYPGLAHQGTAHVLTGVHTMHVETNATGGYAYPCGTCHYNYTHNQSNLVAGGSWTDVTVLPANINVRFDPARNAGTNLTYGGAEADSASAPGIATNHNGTCANLYCHGDNTTSQTDWTGTGSPAWSISDPTRLGCGACHTDPPGSGAHTLHADSDGDRVCDPGDNCPFTRNPDGLGPRRTPKDPLA